MNANVNSTASAIAAQPNPSASVSKFLALKPRLFINGEWVEARSGKTVQVFDPATGKQIGLVADAGPEDVDRAVAAARAASATGAPRAGCLCSRAAAGGLVLERSRA